MFFTFLWSSLCLAQPTLNSGSFADPNSAGLKSFYAGNDGGLYYFVRNGSDIYWAMEHPGRDYGHVFQGRLEGSTISGSWWDIPKYGRSRSGEVTLAVNQNGDRLSVTSSSGGFPSNRLQTVSLKQVINQLPRQRNPGFTTNTISNLNGAWRSEKRTVMYIRQFGLRVIAFGETPFSNDQQPATAFLMVGFRNGNDLNVQIVHLPKGRTRDQGRGRFRVTGVNSIQKLSGTNTEGVNWSRYFPNISIPLTTVLNLMEGPFFNRLDIVLDNLNDDNRNPQQNSSVNLRNIMRDPYRFDLPYVQGAFTRYHLSNLTSIGSTDLRIDPNNPRRITLSAEFEEDGRELAGVVRRTNEIAAARSGHIFHPQVDIRLRLINQNGAISYEVESVRFTGDFDPNFTPFDVMDQTVNHYLRPALQEALREMFNAAPVKNAFSNALRTMVTSANTNINNQLNAAGLGNVEITGLVLQGNNIVLQFD
ncbi:hypothetical protein CRP01_08705 [Flavilitoribacter nigricans DSM 23189 = NBRC 102662]|uniref:DUF4403 family protein n=1 Tax=Flavilitoribacter nigricans (strain ATCC 23147 / DSM 23189 / NBRC 102662 / NCIMB 1420 / SS-2) TaxID=1122177 RepID=A0A2D0NF48_FLAN2|nr:hypothetical protein CRP01_08705 [Flavilitoribacter nigricans DSM 23189 = NBRC 102662]